MEWHWLLLYLDWSIKHPVGNRIDVSDGERRYRILENRTVAPILRFKCGAFAMTGPTYQVLDTLLEWWPTRKARGSPVLNNGIKEPGIKEPGETLTGGLHADGGAGRLGDRAGGGLRSWRVWRSELPFVITPMLRVGFPLVPVWWINCPSLDPLVWKTGCAPPSPLAWMATCSLVSPWVWSTRFPLIGLLAAAAINISRLKSWMLCRFLFDFSTVWRRKYFCAWLATCDAVFVLT